MPEERRFKVYCFVAARHFQDGNIREAFWHELCACKHDGDAAAIRTLCEQRNPGIRYVVDTQPPSEIPDHNVYDLDGFLVLVRPNGAEGQA